MPARTVLKSHKKTGYANPMVRADDGRRHPHSDPNRTTVTTRYGRWILARRKLVNHLANGKAKYRIQL